MGAQLFQPFCRGVPGDADYGLHAVLVQGIAAGGDLMRPLDLRGVHGAAVLRPLQDREPLEIHMGRSLKYCCKICC